MIFTVQFTDVAVTAQQDFFELVAGSADSVLIHSLGLFQTTEVGDAAEEALTVLLKSGQTTSGSGGSAPTAIPRKLGATAFAGTTEANNTTKASAGTIVTKYVWGWNVRAPLVHIWTPETRPLVNPGTRMTVELGTTPADSITMSGYLEFEIV
jgi:hypothetical protein